MTFGQRRDLAARLRAIPLERVLPLCGARPDHDDHRKWHTPAGALSVTGAKFMNWTWRAGGGGAIDLVIHLHHLDFKARRRLAGRPLSGTALPPTAGVHHTPPPHLRLARLPDPSQLARVRDYLIASTSSARRAGGTRSSTPAPSTPMPGPTPSSSCADKHRLPVGAELRGTTATPWHGLAPGSQKDLGCFAIPRRTPMPARGPLRIGHRCHQLLRPPSRLPLPLHRRSPAQPALAAASAGPRVPGLLRLRRRSHRRRYGRRHDRPVSASQPLRPPEHDWNDVLRAQS